MYGKMGMHSLRICRSGGWRSYTDIEPGLHLKTCRTIAHADCGVGKDMFERVS